MYFQERYCDFLDKLVEDDSWAAYIMTDKDGPTHCKQFSECKVLAIPEVIDKVTGAGWIFPKKSPLLPMFNHYVSLIKEGGIYEKMKNNYNDQLVTGQVCPDYDGKPIGLPKCFSLFGLLSAGGILSLILLL